jgi:L-aspartate oxidase
VPYTFDYLVIGSGVAGLTFALKVAETGSVAVVTKNEPNEANTTYAQGGIASVMDPEDTFESHIRDTLVAGAGLCDQEVVELVIRQGPERIRELIKLGTDFTYTDSGLSLGREGGHSRHRVVHARDETGREVERALLQRVREHHNIELFPFHFALELLTEHHLGQTVTRLRPDIHCFGAYVLNEKNGEVHTFLSRVTMLATGGAGLIYTHSTNPPVATGDGVAMAYRAKARVANMEFIQFHPTALYLPEGDRFLISEAVRGAGGRLVNQGGERFMERYDERLELAPRDIVARAIDHELKQRGDSYVWLDISHVESEKVLSHFPNIAETCKLHGIDITKQPIPVVPAAHYVCGGVATDTSGHTSIARLFASGEVACTGLHGANRLASNSLLEALVFSHRAVKPASEIARSSSFQHEIPDWDDSGTSRPNEWVLLSHNRLELQKVMSDYVGIVRSSLRLQRAGRRLKLLYEETEDFFKRVPVSTRLCELRNLFAVAYLVIRCAAMRRESRGLHFTTDFPESNDGERRDSLV